MACIKLRIRAIFGLSQRGGHPMRCSKCGSENPAGNNFCARCGNALARLCLKCGAENTPPANCCAKCAAALTTLVRPPVSATPPIQSLEAAGERRHLTVLFCDLVGSTGIATRLDPGGRGGGGGSVHPARRFNCNCLS